MGQPHHSSNDLWSTSIVSPIAWKSPSTNAPSSKLGACTPVQYIWLGWQWGKWRSGGNRRSRSLSDSFWVTLSLLLPLWLYMCVKNYIYIYTHIYIDAYTFLSAFSLAFSHLVSLSVWFSLSLSFLNLLLSYCPHQFSIWHPLSIHLDFLSSACLQSSLLSLLKKLVPC